MLPERLRSTVFQPRLEWLLGFAAFLSLALILTPKNLFTHTYHLEPAQLTAQLFDDKYSGGNSGAVWIDETNKHWHCTLGQNYKNPYCSLRLALMDINGVGLDLSHAATLTLRMKYNGDGSHLRIYLRNRGAPYFIPGDDLSEKYNMAEIPVKSLDQGLTIKMDEFSVADWWISQRQIPLKDTRPEFNNLSDMEIQTGSSSVSGEHDITLEEISWNSPLISELQLYRGITIFWTSLIVLYLLIRITTMKIALNRQQNHQKELVAINSLLTSQSRRFEDLAKTDSLTGLNNRVAMQEALYQGLNNWKRHNTPFSMILLDIDHFKKINDTYGHDAGDEVLKFIANLLRNNIREEDFLARWGGEEFVLLYPKTHQLGAMTAAELLRKKIAAASNPWGISITASFGVATIASGDLDILFKSADEALYRAKNSGRNCVMGELVLHNTITHTSESSLDPT